MPRKKPVKSTDLQSDGEGILKGIHYDPFEDSVYRIKGLIPGFFNLIHPLIASLSSGPEIRTDLQISLENPEDKPIKATVLMSFDTHFSSINLHIGKKVLPMKRDLNNWSAGIEIPPGRAIKAKPVASCFGYPEVVGTITVKRTFL